MLTLWLKNQKLPAWIGSILFHVIMVLLILFWSSFQSNHTFAPGDRIAIGSIVLQPDVDALLQSSSSPNTSQNTDSDIAEIITEKFSNTTLDVQPSTMALVPGQNFISNTGIESVTGLATSFQQGIPGDSGIGNQTGRTTVRIFGTSGNGTKFMYVFDRSASMDGAPIHAAKKELTESLASLNEFHQFNILFYSSGWELWRPGKRLVFATPTEKENAKQFVAGIMATGGTRHFEPLKEAIAHRPDVIFFLTDGESQDDLTSVQISDIERANSRWGYGTQINVIQFGHGGLTDSPSRSLQQLAEQNNGQYQYVNVAGLR